MPAKPPVRQIAGWFDAVVVIGRKITDRRAHAHNLRVARLCVHIGRQLSMSARELRLLARAGLVHDLGRFETYDAALDGRSLMDRPDWRVEASGEMGMIMVERAGQSSRELRAILYHHERLDGSGYPFGLTGDEIPIEARILGVADLYDELTSDHLDRRALTTVQARRVLQKEAGTGLDGRVVAALFAELSRHQARGGRAARRVLAF